ncbi:Putative uncharacterized protein [Moritella viscosa]|uniref:hypothetical protein n=1 Tax=Moritella viscosa TaxID=80854 RepID=UPI00091B16A6|nr:hypothetical protein [Moritella viscosa]SGY93126.1 Putative uncharacterized protein [Moritella viscosa]
MEYLKDKSGIYRIILDEKSEIKRLNGSDHYCILYIGHAKESNTLMKRVRDFYDSASNVNSNGEPPMTHQAGRFYQLYLKKFFGEAVDNLRFEFVVTDSDPDAVLREYTELKAYLDKHGELPPLNNQLPKAGIQQ